MATNNTAAANRGIDEVLHQTEMGSFIAKNKSLIIALIVLAILGVAGFGLWSWMSSKENIEAQTSIHEFTQGSLKSYQDKKIDANALVQGFENVSKNFGSYKGVFPLGIETASLLIANGENQLALSVLQKLDRSADNSYQKFILATNLAVVYENAGDNQKALESLESLVKSNITFMQSKVYLDLGRLAMQLGQTDKARTNLQWVIDDGKDAEMTLLARLYLSKLDK